MKKFWREKFLKYSRLKGKALTSIDFPLIFKEVWFKSSKQQGIMNGNFH